MDWNIFWSAFGAIGTTIGSLITAIAVVVAVKQYKQPITKLIKVEFNSSIAVDINNKTHMMYTLSVKNKGVRDVVINGLYVKGKGSNLFINNMQTKMTEFKVLPIMVGAEQCIEFYFNASDFQEEIKRMIESKHIDKQQKFVVFVIDSLGDSYFCKTKIRVGQLVKKD